MIREGAEADGTGATERGVGAAMLAEVDAVDLLVLTAAAGATGTEGAA